jgi:hypothetical protein
VKDSHFLFPQKTAQQSVHPTLGILARFQAFFYASAFSQSDGVPPPAPARVTQTVGHLSCKSKLFEVTKIQSYKKVKNSWEN